jgi:predicted ATPase
VHQVESLTIDRDGRINRWPEGFFDQWDIALEQLI